MTAKVTILTASPRCGKTASLQAIYRKSLAGGMPGESLWLAPTQRSAMAIRDQLLADDQLEACFSPAVMTFGRFADSVLAHSPAAIRPLGPLAKRQLLRGILDDMAARSGLDYFAPILETGGMVDLVSRFISEMKRLEIWPDEFRAACQARGATAKDLQLADIYDRYQQALGAHQLYDAEGRFWSARDLLQKGQLKPLERIRLVIADGFTDFTWTQHEILEILASRAERLIVSLPLESDSRRSALFAKPQQTLDELLRRHKDNARRTTLDASAENPSPLQATTAHLVGQLFLDPRQANDEVSAGGITILAASGQVDEIERVAAAVKTLLTTAVKKPGVQPRPSDIVVAFRTLEPIAPLAGEVFGEYGVPFAIESGVALAGAPIIKSLVELLELAKGDWQFRQLLAVISSNFVNPAWPELAGRNAALAAERIIREFQLPHGRGALLARVDRLAQATLETSSDEQAGRPSPSPHQRHQRSWARDGWPLLSGLARSFDALPTRASATDWATALTDLADDLGLLPAEAASSSDKQAEIAGDRAAWRRLTDALRESDRLAQWLGDTPPQWTLAQLVDQITEIVQCEQLPGRHDDAGRVRIVSVSSLRTLRVPYLFLAGLSEQAFPARDREDPIYNESRRSELIEGGLRLPRRADGVSEEMLLFYEAVTRATTHLWLSYPAMNEKAQPLLPSPYLSELQRIFHPGSIEQIIFDDLGPIAPDPLPLCARDLRVRALHDGLEDRPQTLGHLASWPPTASSTKNIGRALLALDDRQQQERFGIYEGMIAGDTISGNSDSDNATTGNATRPPAVENLPLVAEVVRLRPGKPISDEIGYGKLSSAARPTSDTTTGNAVIGELTQRFGPHSVWSASRLEEYGKCPFHFFLDRVLRIQPLPELEVETDHLTRGRLLHDTLAATHRQLNDLAGGPTSPTGHPPEQFLTGFRQHLEAIGEQIRRDTPMDRALLQIDLTILSGLAEVYLQQHREYEKKLTLALLPKHFEISFGLPIDDDDAVDPSSTPDPYVVGQGDDAVRLAGRIDRVDVAQVGGQILYNVVDYKSGSSAGYKSPKDAAIDAGHLQLDIYALAAAEVLFAGTGAIPWKSGYWFIKKTGFKDWVSMHEPQDGDDSDNASSFQETELWTARRKQLSDLIVNLVHGVRGGQFPVISNDDQCTSRCPHHTVCRVNQIRSLEKTWQPPAPSRS